MDIINFYPMNVMIKGTASAIQEALQADELPDYTIDASSTYQPNQVDSDDHSIKTAKIVFEMFNEACTTSDKMPLGNNPSIKFLMLVCGGPVSQYDGTSVIYKDFSEKEPSVVWQMDSYVNPHMEEFDGGQRGVLERVWGSFLDHEWSFSFEDYSCGELKAA